MVGVLALVAQAWAVDCDQWDTWDFFKVATLEEVRGCLEAGAEVNTSDWGEDTPLHGAVRYSDNPAIVALLLDAGAEVNAERGGHHVSTTPLHHAVWSGNIEIIRLLLEAGADLSNTGIRIQTPLHHAAFRDDPGVLQFLLDAGADVNLRGFAGISPLHFVAGWPPWGDGAPDGETCRLAGLTLLLKAGADVNARDDVRPEGGGVGWTRELTNWGETPLHYAAREGCELAIETLLDFGADPTLQSARGDTPWDLIKDREELKDTEAYRRLREATLGPE